MNNLLTLPIPDQPASQAGGGAEAKQRYLRNLNQMDAFAVSRKEICRLAKIARRRVITPLEIPFSSWTEAEVASELAKQSLTYGIRRGK